MDKSSFPSPLSQLRLRPSSAALSNCAELSELREGGGEKERGRGCCGSHFIEQPGSGQGCRITLQQPNGCCSKKKSRRQTQNAARVEASDSAPCLLAADSQRPQIHPSPFINSLVFVISDALACCAAQSEAVCVSVYSPARSGSLSLIEAPVIVGGLLL